METMELAMSLIAGAGDSKSDSMEAIIAAKKGDFQAARDLIEKASASMEKTHEIQTGNPRETTLLMVHAQDHLCSAQMLRDLAIEFTDLYELVMKGVKKE